MFLFPGFLPINLLIDGLFASVLGLLFIPSLISFSINSMVSLVRLIFPEMPPVEVAE